MRKQTKDSRIRRNGMKITVQLESKDVRTIIARYLGIEVEDDVVPNRYYNFSVVGMTIEEIERRIEDGERGNDG